jgi:hypothetical protein
VQGPGVYAHQLTGEAQPEQDSHGLHDGCRKKAQK